MRALFLLAAWLVVSTTTQPHAGVIERTDITPFERGDDGIVLAVQLNGSRPFRFLLDTGSTHSAVSVRTAAGIAAPVVAKAPMGSAAGSRDTLVVRINSLEVGPVTVPALLGSVVDFGAIGEDADIDGIIGHDVLASLRYTIDFRGRRVVWWPREAELARGSSLPLESSHGRFLLSLTQHTSALRLVPDSGAATLLLFTPHAALPIRSLKYGYGDARCLFRTRAAKRTPCALCHRPRTLSPRRLTDGSTSVGYPSWSPDERHVAVEIKEGSSTQAGVIDVETGVLRRLTNASGQTWVRSWSRPPSGGPSS